MDMPANLKSLPPEALSILRYYGARNKTSALADDIVYDAQFADVATYAVEERWLVAFERYR